MAEEKPPVLVTNDSNDNGEFESVVRRAGLVEVSPAMLLELARAARSTHSAFLLEIAPRMTPKRAARVRVLRCEERCSWRALASQTADEWGALDATWRPPSNQIAGMALCELAAPFFGEDHNAEPWN